MLKCFGSKGKKEEKCWIGQNVQNVVINPKRMGKAAELSGSVCTDGSSTQSGCILTAAELKCTCARWHFDPRAQRIKECEWARRERVSSRPSLFVRAVPSQSYRPLVQVRLIRECGAGSVQSFLNKTWGSQRGGGAKKKKSNQIKTGHLRLSQAAGTNTPATHHMCPHTNDKPKRRHRATSSHNQSVFIHDMSIN